MSKTTIGILLCLMGLILLQRNLLLPGLGLFVFGFLLLNKKNWPWRRK